MGAFGCFICEKHVQAELSWSILTSDELIVVSHLPLVTPSAGEGAEHVYAAVIGHGVAHPPPPPDPRYPGTPREYWWTRLDEWPAAPRGDADAVAALLDRLRGVRRRGPR